MKTVKIGDPSDKLDAAADGNFGGKHTTNRRAGYGGTVIVGGEELTDLEWLIRRAKKDATLASGEGRKIVEHYEAELDALWRTLSDQIVIGNQMQDSLIRQDRILAALREPSEGVVVACAKALRQYHEGVTWCTWEALKEQTRQRMMDEVRVVLSSAVAAAEQEASDDTR